MNEKKLINDIFRKLIQKDEQRKEIVRPKLREILWHKFCYWVEINTSFDILIYILKTVLIISLSIGLLYPEKSKILLIYLFYYKSFYFAKIIASSLLIIYVEDIYFWIKEKVVNFNLRYTIKSREISQESIEEKIIKILIREKSFKQKFIPELEITQKEFHSWSKKLEERHILIRGDKNSRILNPELSLDELQKSIYKKEKLEIFNSREIRL